MSEIKLLPCPICSKDVYIGTEDYDDNIEDVIVCDHCNLKFYGSYPATKEDLAEEWNTRKPMERIIEKLGRLPYADDEGFVWLEDAKDVVKEEGVVK